jgi:hypothetical protein
MEDCELMSREESLELFGDFVFLKREKMQFSNIEDKFLIEFVKEHGSSDWKKISDLMGNRTPRQCKDRWNHYLNPNLKTSYWIQDEDDLLIEKVNQYGPRWIFLSQFFQGRTDTMCKNRWKLLNRKIQKNFKLKNPSKIANKPLLTSKNKQLFTSPNYR